MENLQEQLTIENACIEEWTHRKTKKDGLKVNFTVSAMLPKLLAEQLKCAGIYESDTTRIDLSHKLKDVELFVPIPGEDGAFSSFFPDVLYAFKAKRDEQQFTLEFAAHVTVRAEELHEILKGLPEVITLHVRPRQGQLFDGGTRVDVTSTPTTPEADSGCVACNNDIPIAEGRPGWHASGVACTANMMHPDTDAAPLASAVAMGEGTHQAAGKRKPRAGSGTVN